MIAWAGIARRIRPNVGQLVRAWPWLISLGLHVGVLAVLSAVVFISFEVPPERAEIVPSARLGKADPRLPLFHREPQPAPLSAEELLDKMIQNEVGLKIDPVKVAGGQFDVASLQSFDRPDPLLNQLAEVTPAAPNTQFFGNAGNAYSVVYVVDRSASMIVTIDPLKRELKGSLVQLQPMQKFHVIFFSAGTPVEGPGRGLVWASERNKRQYFTFIDGVSPEGRTDPLPAMQRALELEPDLIYLLTDGVFRDTIAQRIIELGKTKKTRINTIAYVRETGEALLRRIAEETGGVYRYISEEQLGWQ